MNQAASLPADRTRLDRRTVFVRYVAFAVISSLANLGTQELAVQSFPAAPIFVSILLGTGVGFVTKYLLDKRWVFADPYSSHGEEARKVVLYGALSVITTLLFWGTELAAWTIWHTAEAKYIGGAIGLAVGNWIKYRLDKRFVFRTTP